MMSWGGSASSIPLAGGNDSPLAPALPPPLFRKAEKRRRMIGVQGMMPLAKGFEVAEPPSKGFVMRGLLNLRHGGRTSPWRWVRVFLWGAQGVLWLAPLAFMAAYYLVAEPRFAAFQEQGLDAGFNGLAGVIAARAPSFEEARQVRGGEHPWFWGLLKHPEDDFSVWMGRDERPSWNAGTGTLEFNPYGKLDWVSGLGGRKFFTSGGER